MSNVVKSIKKLEEDTIEIILVTGQVYLYTGVCNIDKVIDDFKNSDNWGRYYNQNIKGRYDCIKLGRQDNDCISDKGEFSGKSNNPKNRFTDDNMGKQKSNNMKLADLYNIKNRCQTEIKYLEEKIDKEHFEGEILAPVLDYIKKLEEMVDI